MKKIYKKHMRSSIALPIVETLLCGIASGCNGYRQANHWFNPFQRKKVASDSSGFEKDKGFTYKKIAPPKPPRSCNPEGHSVVMATQATIPAKIKGIWVLSSDADSTSCLLVVEQGTSLTIKADHPDKPADNRVGFLFSIPKRKLTPAFWTMLDQTIQVAEDYKPGFPCKCVKVALQGERLEVEVTGTLVDDLIKQAKKLDYREVTSGAQELTGWTHFDTSTRIEAFERTNTLCGKGAAFRGVLKDNTLQEGERLNLVLAKDRDPSSFLQGVQQGLFPPNTNCTMLTKRYIVCPLASNKKESLIYGNVDKKDLDGMVLLKEYPVMYGCVQKDTYRVAPKGIRKVTRLSLFELKPTAKKRNLVHSSFSFSSHSMGKPPVEPEEHIYDIPYHYPTF